MSEEAIDKKFHRLTCSNCRKKKARCDGAYPFCMNCKNSKQKCIYDKPASISYVRHLEKQVESLARKLQSYESDDSQIQQHRLESPFDTNVHEHLNRINQEQRDPNEGLEFNLDNLSTLMSDLEIKRGPVVNSNSTSVPFTYVADTLRFAHYFDAPLYKDAPSDTMTGSQLIQLVTSIRHKCSSGDVDFKDPELVREFIQIGLMVSAHGFLFHRPHYINKYFRDYSGFLGNSMKTLESTDFHLKNQNKFGFDFGPVVMTFSMAAAVFYRTIVSPYVQAISNAKTNKDLDFLIANAKKYSEETWQTQLRVHQMIGKNLFAGLNPSMVQSCLHASVAEVMLTGSLSNAALLSNIGCRLAIELFEHYSSTLDGVSTLWFLRILWACYCWDKIISSCCNRNPIFPSPPPLSPSDMPYNPMDTMPCIDKDGNVVLEIDGRPTIIVTCRLSIILSDVLLRRHHLTKIRVHLNDLADEVFASLPDELTPVFNLLWDETVHYTEPLKVLILPPNFPVELILPIAMYLAIKLELYCESFVNIAENAGGPNPNTLENKYVVFQNVIKLVKLTGAFAKILSEQGPYKGIAAAAGYINPWFKLSLMKSAYKLLMNDELVKLIVLLTDETPSDEVTNKHAKANYEFVNNPHNIELKLPETNIDDSMPADLFVQNIVFGFSESSNFKHGQIKNRYYYLKYIISYYVALAQASVTKLLEFRSPLSREVLAQSLVTRPAVLDVFGEERETVIKAISLLPDPRFDHDIFEGYSYSKLLDMVNNLGTFGETLLRQKQNSSSSNSSKSPGSRSDSAGGKSTGNSQLLHHHSSSSTRVTPTSTPPTPLVNKKRSRLTEQTFIPQVIQNFQPEFNKFVHPSATAPPQSQQFNPQTTWVPNIPLQHQQQQQQPQQFPFVPPQQFADSNPQFPPQQQQQQIFFNHQQGFPIDPTQFPQQQQRQQYVPQEEQSRQQEFSTAQPDYEELLKYQQLLIQQQQQLLLLLLLQFGTNQDPSTTTTSTIVPELMPYQQDFAQILQNTSSMTRGPEEDPMMMMGFGLMNHPDVGDNNAMGFSNIFDTPLPE